MRIATRIHRDTSNGPITKLRSYEDGQSSTNTRDEPVTDVVAAINRRVEYRVGIGSGPIIVVVDPRPANGEYIRSEQDGKVVNNLAELPTF